VSYQVLARKYRPQTFAEVIGQDHVVRILSNAIATGRIAHAFLLVGPRGIGKTSTARILAKALNCSGGPKVDFDPNDPVCREIAEGRSMDVLEIDGASNRGVDQIRDLRDNVQYAPATGNFKIYIIDEVHMLTTEAFNALLKTLEEPPAHVKFIFATTEAHKVLPTILSRCQRFDLKRISDKDIVKQLRFIAGHEKITVSDAALGLLARNAEGGMRDAESSFDQLISFCGNTIEEKDVLEIFGLTGHQEVWNLAEAIQAGEAEVALQHLHTLIQRGKDLTRLAPQLLRYFRNMLLYIISPEIAGEDVEADEIRHFANLKPLPSRELILAFIEELMRLEEKIRFALVREVLFEIAVIRMTQQLRRVSLEEVLATLVKGGAAPQSAPPAAKPLATPRPAVLQHTPAATPPEPAATTADPLTVWNRAIEPLKKKEVLLRRALDFCVFTGGDRTRITIKLHASRAMRDAVEKSATLKEALAKGFGPDARLEIDFTEKPEDQPVEPAVPPTLTPRESNTKNNPAPAAHAKLLNKADFENDPLIQEALREFDARIVSIRQDATT